MNMLVTADYLRPEENSTTVEFSLFFKLACGTTHNKSNHLDKTKLRDLTFSVSQSGAKF